jgi:hypothetical protein
MRNCGKARRARKAIMLDNSVGESIIKVVGGEDRALLRSNPSARTDAGIAAGGYSVNCLPPPVRSNDPGHKAANLGVWGGAPIQKTVFSACPACHLARSAGAGDPGPCPHRSRDGLLSRAPAGACGPRFSQSEVQGTHRFVRLARTPAVPSLLCRTLPAFGARENLPTCALQN